VVCDAGVGGSGRYRVGIAIGIVLKSGFGLRTTHCAWFLKAHNIVGWKENAEWRFGRRASL